MCRRGQVRDQQRLRMRHGVPDVKMVVLSRQKLKLNLVNLEPRKKSHVCVRNVRRCGVVFTEQESPLEHCPFAFD